MTTTLPAHVPLAPTLQQVERLLRALGSITYDEFCEVLWTTIGAMPDYALTCWPSFRQYPMGYCLSRDPIEQGEALFALALAKMNKADATGRDINCAGEGQCHGGSHRCASCGDVDRVCHKVAICKYHGPVSAATVMKDALDTFNGRGAKHPVRREHLIEGLVRRFAAHADFTASRAKDVVDYLGMTGEVIPHRFGYDWLQRPLLTLKVGEHSDECPTVVKYWDEQAKCDPVVCAHVPIAKPVDDDED